MVRIRGETAIARPVEDVFDFVADERNEPKYNPRMVRAEKATTGPIGKGTRWVASVRSGRRRQDIAMEVIDYTRPSRLATVSVASATLIDGAVTFEPVPGGTRARWSWNVRPTGALRLLTPVVGWMGRRQERQIWDGLKRYLENAEPDAAGKR